MICSASLWQCRISDLSVAASLASPAKAGARRPRHTPSRRLDLTDLGRATHFVVAQARLGLQPSISARRRIAKAGFEVKVGCRVVNLEAGGTLVTTRYNTIQSGDAPVEPTI